MGGDDYVLRICGKDTAVLGIDRDAECAATMAAAQVGVGPEVVAYRPDLQVLVTRWVEGRPATAEELRASPALEEIAAALRAVHAGAAARCELRRVHARRAITATRFASAAAAIPTASTRPRRAAARIQATLSGPDHDAGALPQRPAAGELPPRRRPRSASSTGSTPGWATASSTSATSPSTTSFGDGRRGAPARGLLRRAVGAGALAALRLMRVMSDFREAMWGAVQDGRQRARVRLRRLPRRALRAAAGGGRAPEFERSLADAAAA